MTSERLETRHGRGWAAWGAGALALAVTIPGVWLAFSAHSTVTASPAAPATAPAAPTATPTLVATPTPTPSVAATPSTSPAPLSLVLPLSSLGISGTVSVAAYDLATGSQLTAGTGAYETASIVKVDILVVLLVRRAGVLTSAQKSLASQMITESDNAAATALFQSVGSAAGLNSTNRQLGLLETTAGTNGNWGLTTTTAADQMRLLRLLYQPTTLLSTASQSYVTSLMSKVETDQDWGVTKADDDQAGFAVKNGWLPRTTTGLWDVTSIGYVQTQGHSLLLVVLVNQARSEDVGISTIEHAAVAAAGRLVAV